MAAVGHERRHSPSAPSVGGSRRSSPTSRSRRSATSRTRACSHRGAPPADIACSPRTTSTGSRLSCDYSATSSCHCASSVRSSPSGAGNKNGRKRRTESAYSARARGRPRRALRARRHRSPVRARARGVRPDRASIREGGDPCYRSATSTSPLRAGRWRASGSSPATSRSFRTGRSAKRACSSRSSHPRCARTIPNGATPVSKTSRRSPASHRSCRSSSSGERFASLVASSG